MSEKGRLLAALALVGGALITGAPPRSTLTAQGQSATTKYVVVYTDGASTAAARAALTALGAKVIKEDAEVGVATVETTRTDFLSAVRSRGALLGAVRHRPIGQIPTGRPKLDEAELEQLTERFAANRFHSVPKPPPAAEPLAGLQWDMAMIHATSTESHAKQLGSPRVLVGVMDTGIDGSHPDLAPNFSTALSRNFTTDLPDVDGPCEVASCVDPANVDENGHGTHVAGTIGAKLNGLGIAGVAPNVTLVNIRAGQDSGYFFLQPVVDALVYAGKAGIDVVNMSFFVDPWMFNCPNNPADLPEAQLEQRTIIAAVQRAVNYARLRGVTLVASLGNSHLDLGLVESDSTSPNYPPGIAYVRPIDNTCLTVPAETKGVISVSALGPSKAKADYSNYGVEQTDVSAPGGYFRDLLGAPEHRTPGLMVLSAYPQALAEASGVLNPDGSSNSPFVVRDCSGSVCAYYQYLQGTSMAAPHATGVAALIVSQFGVPDFWPRNGLTLSPTITQRLLQSTATDTACPDPALVDYTLVGRTPDFNALCVGTPAFNGFYGHGIVNALKAVTPFKP
jgi:subtilisin family serine protease